MGINVWGNGEKYIGEWKNDKRDGAGTNSYNDGKIEKGIWRNDKYISQSKNLEKSVIPENKMINASSGTGFAISKKGHLITNYHVIKGCQKVRIHNKSTVIEANVINFDPQNDLALIKGNFIPNQVLSISNDQTNLLQDIYVAGFPFGKRISTSIKITKGIVSSLTGVGNNYSNFQIDAAIQPGNSGGPILNDKGNVIGVAVAKLDLKYASRNFGVIPENTNFGIKSSVIKSILEGENIKIIAPNDKPISKIELGKKITNSTFYLSCWMNYAQIKKMKSQKVIYNKF
jgi:S1-C subfamily serine protease